MAYRCKQKGGIITIMMGFPGGSVVKNSPAVQETQARSLGCEYPLEQEMATHFSILAKRIPLTWGYKELDTTSDFTFTDGIRCH